jgi:predicted HD superfamily hydrolase involved in NAD metabolism
VANDLASLVIRRVQSLPIGLQDHIHRVEKIAQELGEVHGVDPQRAGLAMLCHDVARAMGGDELLRRASHLELPGSLVEKQVPILLHGPVGAEILKTEDGLSDDAIYQAVYWHTTAHPSLDQLGKVVFLADKLDPQKIDSYPFQPRIRDLASHDLDRGILEFLTQELIARANRGELVHPAAVETRNALLSAIGRNSGQMP